MFRIKARENFNRSGAICVQRNIALFRLNPGFENFAFHQMGEVKCLYFLNRLGGIAQFGFKTQDNK